MRILITGATGFVGREVVAHLAANSHYTVRRAVRWPETLPMANNIDNIESVVIGDIGPETDWSAALQDVDVVVHAAARVHLMHDSVSDPLEAFRRVNTAGTLSLARQAADAGARRFVYLSTIKVNGEETAPGRPFTPADEPSPLDPYGISKHEAECGLAALARERGLEVVIIRPVLVYGPGVRANFRAMMSAVEKRIPLPFGALHNRRSLVAVQNLSALIDVCLWHPAAPNEVFLVSDDDDLSTTELLRRIGRAMRRPALLLPVPQWALAGAAKLLGRSDLVRRLIGSLQVDIEKTRRVLAWSPPMTVDEALTLTATRFLSERTQRG